MVSCDVHRITKAAKCCQYQEGKKILSSKKMQKMFPSSVSMPQLFPQFNQRLSRAAH